MNLRQAVEYQDFNELMFTKYKAHISVDTLKKELESRNVVTYNAEVLAEKDDFLFLKSHGVVYRIKPHRDYTAHCISRYGVIKIIDREYLLYMPTADL